MMNEEEKRIMADLADWLEEQAMEHMDSEYKEALDLVKRAREAIEKT